MSEWRGTRREFGKTAALSAAALAVGARMTLADNQPGPEKLPDEFYVKPEEITLRALQTPGKRAVSFGAFKGDAEAWRKACFEKLTEAMAYEPPKPGRATRLRSIEHQGVTIEAWTMQISDALTVPGYLLLPKQTPKKGHAIMAIHGHGRCEPCIGGYDEYHHFFALRLAQAGHVVLCPELRGFGAMCDMAASTDNYWLDYWGTRRGGCQFTLATDTFLYGRSIVGQTVEDIVRWENWLAEKMGVEAFDVTGISYGGDLAFTYPPFSKRTRKIYSSGSMGSFSAIFSQCYNAPAHCIPGILQWMDRSDIAGLNAPHPIRLHYGELDVPGPRNGSASYNNTVTPAYDELLAIYKAFGAEDKVSMRVTPQTGHEYEIDDLLKFMAHEG